MILAMRDIEIGDRRADFREAGHVLVECRHGPVLDEFAIHGRTWRRAAPGVEVRAFERPQRGNGRGVRRAIEPNQQLGVASGALRDI